MADKAELELLEVLNKLKESKRSDRVRKSIYVSKDIYDRFTRMVGEGNRSLALEELMLWAIRKK